MCLLVLLRGHRDPVKDGADVSRAGFGFSRARLRCCSFMEAFLTSSVVSASLRSSRSWKPGISKNPGYVCSRNESVNMISTTSAAQALLVLLWPSALAKWMYRMDQHGQEPYATWFGPELG